MSGLTVTVAVVNRTTPSAAISFGGSMVSRSVTLAPTIVQVHDSFDENSVVGSSVKLVGPPVTVAAWAPLDAHEIENQSSATSTGCPATCATPWTG